MTFFCPQDFVWVLDIFSSNFKYGNLKCFPKTDEISAILLGTKISLYGIFFAPNSILAAYPIRRCGSMRKLMMFPARHRVATLPGEFISGGLLSAALARPCNPWPNGGPGPWVQPPSEDLYYQVSELAATSSPSGSSLEASEQPVLVVLRQIRDHRRVMVKEPKHWIAFSMFLLGSFLHLAMSFL
jgi:hypothetical protein